MHTTYYLLKMEILRGVKKLLIYIYIYTTREKSYKYNIRNISKSQSSYRYIWSCNIQCKLN